MRAHLALVWMVLVSGVLLAQNPTAGNRAAAEPASAGVRTAAAAADPAAPTPSEVSAYKLGWREGYSQGLLDGMAMIRTAVQPASGKAVIVVDASSVAENDSVGEALAYQLECDVATSGLFQSGQSEPADGFTLSLVTVGINDLQTAASWTLTQDGQVVDSGVVVAGADRAASMAEGILADVNGLISELPTTVPSAGDRPDLRPLLRLVRGRAPITAQ